MERLTNEEEDLIFETKPKLFSIVTIILPKETILLLRARVLEIKSTKESNPEQGTLDQTVTELVLSTMKSKDFSITLKVSLEDKVYP